MRVLLRLMNLLFRRTVVSPLSSGYPRNSAEMPHRTGERLPRCREGNTDRWRSLDRILPLTKVTHRLTARLFAVCGNGESCAPALNIDDQRPGCRGKGSRVEIRHRTHR